MQSNQTNSEIGSHHWFITLMARVKNIGEYLRDKPEPTPPSDTLHIWGHHLYDAAKEVIEWFSDSKRKKWSDEDVLQALENRFTDYAPKVHIKQNIIDALNDLNNGHNRTDAGQVQEHPRLPL